VGKEEDVSGSLCGGRGCNFGGKLKEAHFSLLPSFVSTTGFRELFDPPKLVSKAWCLFGLLASWAKKLPGSPNKHPLRRNNVLRGSEAMHQGGRWFRGEELMGRRCFGRGGEALRR
jgi:hypothetical protein